MWSNRSQKGVLPVGSFVVHLASGESMTVDGEFTIGGNGVLTVVRNQHLRPAVTLHFAPPHGSPLRPPPSPS
ncbi:hypothetical protein I552_7674 [Mycobacterium xenopi 3993]|nr:hypothetical protein I552_7674 [Mycobacterium xenopi 3993]